MDVVIVGTSHVYRGISPMEIWDERGIASYSLATGSQSFSSSYYLIKDAIKTQHPKVIVLEVYGANYTGDYVSLARLHASTDGIPLNATKLELFQELLPRTLTFTESLEFIFPIIAYHSRWEELEEKDFHPMNTFLKGFLMDYDTAQQSEPETTAETSRIYYSCVDFELLREEVGIDYAVDFFDDTHLSSYGAEKISRYLAKYLAENYELSDHRGEKDYLDWEEDYQKYLIMKEKMKSQ